MGVVTALPWNGSRGRRSSRGAERYMTRTLGDDRAVGIRIRSTDLAIAAAAVWTLCVDKLRTRPRTPRDYKLKHFYYLNESVFIYNKNANQRTIIDQKRSLIRKYLKFFSVSMNYVINRKCEFF